MFYLFLIIMLCAQSYSDFNFYCFKWVPCEFAKRIKLKWTQSHKWKRTTELISILLKRFARDLVSLFHITRNMLWFCLFHLKEREDFEFSGTPGPLTFRAMGKNPHTFNAAIFEYFPAWGNSGNKQLSLSGKTLDCRPRDCEFDPPSLQLKLLKENMYWFFPGKMLPCISALHWAR